jgi:hypothetical protein
MPFLHLDWSDGRYSTRPLSAEEATKAEAVGCDVVRLEDHVYDAYVRDCERDSIWQALWRAISNEQSMRRREKELMPLEEAEREITRLKDELARSKRMEAFYEDQYVKNLGDRHREEHVEYTCVYPQPGCQIDALPDEWRESAQEILEQYKPDRMEGSLKYQGCCCSYGNHRLLSAAEAQALRDAGFLVENDTEVA